MITRYLKAGAAAALVMGLAVAPLAAAELPKATQDLLKKKGLDAKVLSGLDAELNTPKAWIDGARKEGLLIVAGTWDADQFDVLSSPFRERYPFIKVKYSRATRHDRVIKPLMAFKTGRVISDVISGVGAKFSAFKQMDAILDLSQLPNWKNVPEGMKAKDGGWVGQRLRYWCMAYNTKRVKKADLPRTWDDLLTTKVLYNQRIGMGNRPNLWLLALWDIKGPDGIKAYASELFRTVKPQLRKEGMNALISLAVAGEFDVALPSAAYRVSQMLAKKAPIGWHCPEPIPMAVSEMLALKKGHTNAALAFVNWFLSKEGQVAQFVANNAPPVHKDLQTKDFLAFPEQIVGKKIAFRDPESMENDLPKLMKIWDPMWLSGLGLKLAVVNTTIEKVLRGGRRVAFKVEGKTHTVKISGSRTKITVNGIDGSRKSLKVGLKCEVTYPGDKEEAKKFDCKK